MLELVKTSRDGWERAELGYIQKRICERGSEECI